MSRFDDPAKHFDVVGRRVEAGAAHRGDFTYCIVEAPRTPGERRSDRRARSKLREGFVADGRRTLADCRIRDLSQNGARLQLDKERPLPKTFLLTEAGTRNCYRATLAWQVGRDAGVRLVPLEDLA